MLRNIVIVTTSQVVFFVLLFAYIKLAGPLPFSINSVITNKTDFFNVTGEGKITIKPDSAIVSVGVNAVGKNANEAKNNMNQKINKVITAVKTLGVDEKDIKTSNFNVYESYDEVIPVDTNTSFPKPPKPQVKSYRADTSLTIKVKEIDFANKVLDTALENDATNIGGVSFDLKDRTKPENDAREMAVKDAKSKADKAAKAAGFKLGKIMSYSENTPGFPGPIYAQSSTAMDSLGGGGTPSNIQPGENEVVISVTLSYEIK